MSDSLSQILKNHTQKQNETKKQNEQLRKNAITATNKLTDNLTTYVNEGVSEMFIRQKELEQESRKLANQTSRYANQTQQWLSLVDNFNIALKELGDVKNWAEIMENDMKVVMSTLEYVNQGTIAGEPVNQN
ncbi:GCN5-like 1 [Backusella circina FSU 941]|nr:GCN5-like 1 [Backusella circina FSU 941]